MEALAHLPTLTQVTLILTIGLCVAFFIWKL